MATKETATTEEKKAEKKRAPKATKGASKKIQNVQKTCDVDEVKAIAKYIRISPLKLQRVANVVRGKSATTALFILKSLPHKGARILHDVLHSAVANATHNHNLQNQELKISTLLINEGPRLKRFQPKGRGRIYEILKRTSHVIVGLKPGKGA